MTDRHDDPGAIARDIDARRVEMGETFAKLQERLAPRRYDEAAASLAGQEAERLAGVALERVRARPLAAAMVVAGLAWLAVSEPPQARRRDAASPPVRADRRRPCAPADAVPRGLVPAEAHPGARRAGRSTQG